MCETGGKYYWMMKHVTEIVLTVCLWLECTFEPGVLLYSTLQYYIEVVDSTVPGSDMFCLFSCATFLFILVSH